jgi:histone deacetylase HOS3
VSNMSLTSNGSPKTVGRPPSPPPPEVPWTIAAHELCKLLIPVDRQTLSCRPEDLSAEATRARRDRQSNLIPPVTAAEPAQAELPRMALRVRKPSRPLAGTTTESQTKRSASRAGRRKTVGGTAVLPVEKVRSLFSRFSHNPAFYGGPMKLTYDF